MKKIIALFLVIGTITFQACEGPMGPPGLDGQDGEGGVNIVGEVFEVEADFTASGNFGFLDPYGFDILDSDKVLVYKLFGVEEERDVWRLLPQTIYLPQGIFSYNYDFTTINYSVFLEGNFDLNTLGSEWTDNQIFRVLIVPADFSESRIDYSDHEAMLRMLKIDEDNIQRKNLN
ncbi:MAG: hypothetical protein WD426_05210 [Anditalea sp.]